LIDEEYNQENQKHPYIYMSKQIHTLLAYLIAHCNAWLCGHDQLSQATFQTQQLFFHIKYQLLKKHQS